MRSNPVRRCRAEIARECSWSRYRGNCHDDIADAAQIIFQWYAFRYRHPRRRSKLRRRRLALWPSVAAANRPPIFAGGVAFGRRRRRWAAAMAIMRNICLYFQWYSYSSKNRIYLPIDHHLVSHCFGLFICNGINIIAHMLEWCLEPPCLEANRKTAWHGPCDRRCGPSITLK